MHPNEKNLLIARISSGTLRCIIDNITYIIKSPSIDIRYKAEELRNKIYLKESINDVWFDATEIKREFVDPNNESNLKALTDKQNDLLVEIYENFEYDNLVRKLKKTLGLIREKINENIYKENCYAFVTADGLADMAKSQYLLAYSVFYEDNTPVWTCKFEDIDYILLDKIMLEINLNHIDYSTIRIIARTDPWRSYWNIQKEQIFDISSLVMTEEQRALISYSKMYDNIYSHHEAPPDKIINDDDALDGWMIKKRKENERQQTEKEIDKLIGKKHENHNELFIMTNNVDKHGQPFEIDREKIDSMNSADAKRIKLQREKTIEQKGNVIEAELPDVKLDLFNQRAKMQNQIRG